MFPLQVSTLLKFRLAQRIGQLLNYMLEAGSLLLLLNLRLT